MHLRNEVPEAKLSLEFHKNYNYFCFFFSKYRTKFEETISHDVSRNFGFSRFFNAKSQKLQKSRAIIFEVLTPFNFRITFSGNCFLRNDRIKTLAISSKRYFYLRSKN